MTNALLLLQEHTVVVADTGDIEAIRRYAPRDATTNPSLLLKAAHVRAYAPLVEAAVADAERHSGPYQERLHVFLDALAVAIGCEIAKIIPGRISTEVDAALSFDVAGTVAKGRALVAAYERAGVPRERVLIKIASTWEGIRAATILEGEGIHCNLTLLFSFAQAVACAQAGVTLVSPFVGRIYDWYRESRGVEDIPIENDPGVASVTKIYNYYKKHGHPTEVMGASFRKADQVLALAGCDLLTISPEILADLQARPGPVPRKLDPGSAQASNLEPQTMNEERFRWMHNQDAMATEKLADGIRRFDVDARRLEDYARARMS